MENTDENIPIVGLLRSRTDFNPSSKAICIGGVFFFFFFFSNPLIPFGLAKISERSHAA